MKRSEINQAKADASKFFEKCCWALPPEPKWDITDFGLGNFGRYGLLLINLTEEKEYCEKLMYAKFHQETPAHYHKRKKEDIICRSGELVIVLWNNDPGAGNSTGVIQLKVNGVANAVAAGVPLHLKPGERVTLEPFVWHAFYPVSEECIISEVSTANDDVNDNFFSNKNIGRFSEIEEDL